VMSGFICGADTRVSATRTLAFLPAIAVGTCITKDFSVDTLKDSKPTLQAG